MLTQAQLTTRYLLALNDLRFMYNIDLPVCFTTQDYQRGDLSICESVQSNIIGFPLHVGGVTQNITQSPNITSIKGLPMTATYFHLNRLENLKTLEGGPVYVYGECSIQHTGLTSLEGGPVYVGGRLEITFNPYLTSVEGIPKYVGGLKIDRDLFKRLLQERIDNKYPAKGDGSSLDICKHYLYERYGCQIASRSISIY